MLLKRTVISLFALLSYAICNAQVKAPVQTDTLFIEKMQYHFEIIKPENWPFKYVVRTASSFIFGDQEYIIWDSDEVTNGVIFWVHDVNDYGSTLKMQNSSDHIVIDFSGYALQCRKNDSVGIPAQKEQNGNFPGMSKKDTAIIALHSASEALDGYNDLQTSGTPNANLKGRNVIGTLPRPTYGVQESGIVVVNIWVDQYGNVTKAQAGAEGTTVTSTELWTAARNAAMKAHFNQKADAPALQQGTITYIFTL